MKTIEQRIKFIQRLKKKSNQVFVMVRPKYVETINEELNSLRSRYLQADQVTRDKYKNQAIGLKMILRELE